MVNKKKEWDLIGKIHSKSYEYRKKLDFAILGLNMMFNTAKKPYLSLSFGKQSICIAHMIYQINPNIPMFFLASDETWSMYNYKEVIEDFYNKWPIDLHVIQTNHFFNSESWKDSRDKGDCDLQNMVDKNKYDGVIMGLAKDESKARKITLLKHTDIHPTIFEYKDKRYRCCPIMNWDIKDISAYVVTNDIKLLNIYEIYGLEQRTTARITKKMVGNNGLGLLRATNSRGFRDINNQFNILNS